MEIMRMTEYQGDPRGVAAVFVSGFHPLMSQLSEDTDKLTDALNGAFLPERTYIAVMDGKPVGMTGLGDRNGRSTQLNKRQFRNVFGLVRGNIGYSILKSELMLPLAHPLQVGNIENVATSAEMRGKGVATAIIQYVFEHSPYEEYILDVIDTNTNAKRLYEKIGFVEFERINNKRAKRDGYNEKIYMRYVPKRP